MPYTWTERQPSGDFDRAWQFVASDEDASVLLAVIGGGSGTPRKIYFSTDSGANWTAVTALGDRFWTGVTCNADGSIMFACAINNRIFRSVNSGVDWTEVRPLGNVNWS